MPPGKDTTVFDIVLPRFALRAKPPRKPGGPWSSWYFIRYTTKDGSERRVKVGSPVTMSLDEARAAARRMLARVDQGGDPAAEADVERAAWTLRQAWEAYANSAEAARKTPKTRTEDSRVAANHVLPRLGAVKLHDLDVPAVKRFHRAVESDTRTNTRKRRLGGPGAARKAVRLLSAVLSWAVGEGHLSRNPIIGQLRLSGDNHRTTILDQPEQYRRLFGTMDAMVADGRLRPSIRALVTLIAATGMRRNEARTLRWRDVDLTARRIALHGTKGAKLARGGPTTETVSVPPIAVAALAAIRPDDAADADMVFPPSFGALISCDRDFRAICQEADLPSGLVLHSLRHSIGTAGIVAGLSTAEVGKMLRHRNIAITARYIHLAESSQSRLQDRATAHLMPNDDAAADAVIPGRRA
jgi:integrase